MYKRYYDGYNPYGSKNTTSYRGEVVIPKDAEPPEEISKKDAPKETPEPSNHNAPQSSVAAITKSSPLNGISRLFNDIEIDDVILLGVILLVLKDSADDPLLIIILLVVFLSGLLEN